MIVVVDYGIGNLASVLNMFKKIGATNAQISSNAEVIRKAEKIVIPGVGAFDRGMTNLSQSGLLAVLQEKALREKVPVLGICLGMQLLTKSSEEGKMNGLGWIDAETVKFNPEPHSGLKVPHMGWDYVTVQRTNPLLDSDTKSRFYFVHSYYVKCLDEKQSIATSYFGHEFTCAVNKDNIFGTQFHPEKSLTFGMKVFENFVKL